ncbi:mucin-2-like [Patella vulgata]|uniref:mucin-2-like n=1 Tax=Patella vulgata TaxID=6465 RepID=UPI0024A9568F|nr:mucin-2-like [Patella vulgata]
MFYYICIFIVTTGTEGTSPTERCEEINGMEIPAFIPSSSVEGLTPDQVDNLRTSDAPLSIIPDGTNTILFTIDLSPNTDEDVDLGSIAFPNAENIESIELTLIDSQGIETPVTDQAGLQDTPRKADFPPETKTEKVRVLLKPKNTTAPVRFNLDVRACFEETATTGTSPTVSVCAEVKGMEDPAIIPTSSITAPGVSNPENLRPGSATTATFPAQSSPISVTIDLAPITDETVEIKSVELVSPQNVGSIRVFVIATGGSETEATYLTATDLSAPIPKATFPAGTEAAQIRVEVTQTNNDSETSFSLDVRACFEETSVSGTSPTEAGTSPTEAGTSPTVGTTTPRCLVTEGMASPTVIPAEYLEQPSGFPSTDDPENLRPGGDQFTINPSDAPTNVTFKLTDDVEPVDLSEVKLPANDNVQTFRVFGRTGPSAPWTLLESTDNDTTDDSLKFPPEVVVTEIMVEITPTDSDKPVTIDVSVHACFVVTTGTEGTSPTVCAEVKGMEDPAIIPASSITAPGVSNPENLRPGSATTATFPAQSSPISVTIDLAPITDETVEIKSVELVSPQNVGSIRVFVIATGGSETEATYLTATDLSAPIPKATFPAGTEAAQIRVEVTQTNNDSETSFSLDVRACFEETSVSGTSPTEAGTSPTEAGTSPTVGTTTPRCLVTEGMASPTVIPAEYLEQPSGFPSTDDPENLRPGGDQFTINPSDAPTNVTFKLTDDVEPVDLSEVKLPANDNVQTFRVFGRTGPSAPWTLLESTDNDTTDDSLKFPPEVVVTEIMVEITPTDSDKPVTIDVSVHACFVVTTGTEGTSPTAPETSPTAPGTSPTAPEPPGTSPTAPGTSPTAPGTSPTAPGTSPTVVCAEVKGMEDPAIIPTSSITAPGVSNPENLRPGTATTATFPAQTSPISVTIDLAPITDETVEIKSVELVSPQNVGSIRVFVIATGGSETEATYLTATDLSAPIPKATFPAGTEAAQIRVEVTQTNNDSETSFSLDVRACFEETTVSGTSPTEAGTSPTVGTTTPRCLVTEGMASPTVIPAEYLEQPSGFPSTDDPENLRPGGDQFTINPSDAPTNVTFKLTDDVEPVDLSEVKLPANDNVQTFRVFGRTGPSAPWTLLESTDNDTTDDSLKFPPDVVVTEIMVEITSTDSDKPVTIDVSVHACFIFLYPPLI